MTARSTITCFHAMQATHCPCTSPRYRACTAALHSCCVCPSPLLRMCTCAGRCAAVGRAEGPGRRLGSFCIAADHRRKTRRRVGPLSKRQHPSLAKCAMRHGISASRPADCKPPLLRQVGKTRRDSAVRLDGVVGRMVAMQVRRDSDSAAGAAAAAERGTAAISSSSSSSSSGKQEQQQR